MGIFIIHIYFLIILDRPSGTSTSDFIREHLVLLLHKHWLGFDQRLDTRNTYSHERFSLIAISYGHCIPPQGKVQSDRSSYDNIIVRTMKGQTTAHVVSAEATHRWLQHCCRANTQQSASGKGINASEDPCPSFHPSPISFLPPTPARTLVWSFSLWNKCSSVACVQKCVQQQNLLRACCLRHPRGILE